MIARPESVLRGEIAREEVAATLAFLERSKGADLITYSIVTRKPLFAHWFTPRWRGIDVTILWCGEPDHETRVAEERIRARKLFESHREAIDPQPWSAR